jgi:hypothetical protein
LAGSIAAITAFSSMPAGSGSWTRMPSTASSALSRSTSAISSPARGGGQAVLEAFHARLRVALPLERT